MAESVRAPRFLLDDDRGDPRAEKIWGKIGESREMVEKAHRAYFDNVRYVSPMESSLDPEFLRANRDDIRSGKTAAFDLSRIGLVVRSLSGQEILSRTTARARPRGKGDVQWAHIRDEVVRYIRDQVRADLKESQAFYRFLIGPLSWLSLRVDVRNGRIPYHVVEAVPLDQMHWDPDSYEVNMHDGSWRARQRMMSKREMDDLMPHLRTKISRIFARSGEAAAVAGHAVGTWVRVAQTGRADSLRSEDSEIAPIFSGSKAKTGKLPLLEFEEKVQKTRIDCPEILGQVLDRDVKGITPEEFDEIESFYADFYQGLAAAVAAGPPVQPPMLAPVPEGGQPAEVDPAMAQYQMELAQYQQQEQLLATLEEEVGPGEVREYLPIRCDVYKRTVLLGDHVIDESEIREGCFTFVALAGYVHEAKGKHPQRFSIVEIGRPLQDAATAAGNLTMEIYARAAKGGAAIDSEADVENEDSLSLPGVHVRGRGNPKSWFMPIRDAGLSEGAVELQRMAGDWAFQSYAMHPTSLGGGGDLRRLSSRTLDMVQKGASHAIALAFDVLRDMKRTMMLVWLRQIHTYWEPEDIASVVPEMAQDIPSRGAWKEPLDVDITIGESASSVNAQEETMQWLVQHGVLQSMLEGGLLPPEMIPDFFPSTVLPAGVDREKWKEYLQGVMGGMDVRQQIQQLQQQVQQMMQFIRGGGGPADQGGGQQQ